MDGDHRWTVVGAGIVIVGGIGTGFLPFVGLFLAAGVAGIVIGYGVADPTDAAHGGLVAGFVGGTVPAVFHVVIFIVASAHDPDPPSLLSIALQPSVVFGGVILASAIGAVCIGSATLVGYLRKRAVV